MSEQLSLPAEVQDRVTRFQIALERLEVLTNTYFSTTPQRFDSTLTPLQRAQVHLTVAQGLHHAFLLYLRTQGLATKDHPINKEGERLKYYGKKVRKLESALFLAQNRPSVQVNIAAANRFINHAIPDLSKEQKAALRNVGNTKSKGIQIAKSVADPAEQARAFLEQTLGQPAAKRVKQAGHS